MVPNASVPHTQLLRKLEVIGYDYQALKWLSDYLTGRSQYVVIEAEDGRRFGMPVGTPQGGAFGPISWREYTNYLPESVKGAGAGIEDQQTRENKMDTDPRKDNEEGRNSAQNWSLSEWIDSKPHQGSEEEHDANMRREGVMLPRERGGGQQGRGSCGQN